MSDNYNSKKIERIKELISEIDTKINILNSMNEGRKMFNFKLRNLLYSIECYSIKEEREVPIIKEIIKPKVKKIAQNEEKIKVEENINTISAESIYNSLENSLPSNMLYRINTKKIINYLFQQGGGAPVNLIMKEASVSKYRTIDIIGVLVRKGIVVKKEVDGDNLYFLIK